MKNRTFAVVLLNLAAVAASAIAFFYIRNVRCRKRYDRCVDECNGALDQALLRTKPERTGLELERSRRNNECRIQHLDNPQAIQQCQDEVNAEIAQKLAPLDAQDAAARAAYERCVVRCRQEAAECEDQLQILGAGGSGSPAIVEVDCLEGGAPCFKPVPELCTQISGPCDDCWTSLCGDEAWTFESDLPLEVSLVAATDPKKDGRVLATSTRTDRKATLRIPKEIRLAGSEQLYIGFSSAKRATGPVKVLLQRRRRS